MRSALLALALMGAPAVAVAASPAAGVWASPVDNAHIEIEPCGSALCGKVVSSGQIAADPGIRDRRNHDLSLRERTLKGLTIMTEFVGGPLEWKGGKVYDPSSGNTYSGSMKLLSSESLKLTGCIIYPLCRSQTWKRVH